MTSVWLRRGCLVADEFVGAAAEADAGDGEDRGQREEDRVPIEHRADHAGRVGEILAGPQGDQRADDEALAAEDEEELATAAAAVEGFDFLGGQVAFLSGDQVVGHVVCLLRLLVEVLNNKRMRKCMRRLEGQMRGSLHSATDDGTVRRSGRDDGTWRGP